MQFAATGQTILNQRKQPTDRQTMRWVFQCFEGINLMGFIPFNSPPHRAVASLEPLHEQVIALLRPSCEKLYKVDGYMGSALQWSENPDKHRGISD